MASDSVTVAPVQGSDEPAWREMWAAYCAFYVQALPPDVTTRLWGRILNKESPIFTVIARDEHGNALGFANYVLHPHTWSDKTLCYLEDLYVRSEARGRNVGYSLIAHLIALGESNGWGRVYWHTEADNIAARRLYDRFKPADDFVRYTVALGGNHADQPND